MEEKCAICKTNLDQKVLNVKERIINKGDMFKYVKCSSCGALSLIDIPKDMSVWYPSDYNPYTAANTRQARWSNIINRLKFFHRKLLTEIIIRQKNENRWYKVLDLGFDKLLKRLYGTRIKKIDKILDVGCASGALLDNLFDMGWKGLTGIDLFVPKSSIRQTKWRFIKGEIFDISNEKFDCIIMNHSFEHMSNPVAVLNKVNDLLNDDGLCIIAVPLSQGPAWREYGADYVQIDAPRHLILYTTESMKILCQKTGFHINRTRYDSDEGIFYFSEAYKKTKKSHGEIMQSFKHTDEFSKIAMQSNRQNDGDEAIFYLRKVK